MNKLLKLPERVLITALPLCLFVGIACQVGNSGILGGNVTQVSIATTPIASPPATQTIPTHAATVILTEAITTTDAPIVETQGVPTLTVTPDLFSNSQLPGKLAFIRNDNLWVLSNGIEKQLTTDAVSTEIPYWTGLPQLWYSHPQLSPDGTKIAYLKNTTPNARALIVSDSDGKNARQIVNDVEWALPIIQWSNDSQKIYYPSSQTSETIIVRSVNITTGEKQEYGHFTFMSGCGGGSPDVADHLSAGENITSVGDVGGGVQIFDLSPQNNYIVHTTACTGSGLGILDLSTKQDRKLDGKAMGAAISPDGLSIAAISGNNVVIYEAGSGKIEKTFPTSEKPLVLLWHTDGKTILYSTSKLVKNLDFDAELAFEYLGSSPASYRVNLSTLWKMSLDRGKSEKITDFEAHNIKPIFATNQKVLVVVVENAITLFDYITQQKPKENMVEYYPIVNIAEVNLATLRSTIVASKTQESSYSIK